MEETLYQASHHSGLVSRLIAKCPVVMCLECHLLGKDKNLVSGRLDHYIPDTVSF